MMTTKAPHGPSCRARRVLSDASIVFEGAQHTVSELGLSASEPEAFAASTAATSGGADGGGDGVGGDLQCLLLSATLAELPAGAGESDGGENRSFRGASRRAGAPHADASDAVATPMSTQPTSAAIRRRVRRCSTKRQPRSSVTAARRRDSQIPSSSAARSSTNPCIRRTMQPAASSLLATSLRQAAICARVAS